MTQPVVPKTLIASEKGRKPEMTKRWAEMFDVAMAAEYLNRSESWIRHEVYNTKQMEPIKIGRLLLFTMRMLENCKAEKWPVKPTRIELENIMSYADVLKYINENGLSLSEGKFKQDILDGHVRRHKFGKKYFVYRKDDVDEYIEYRKTTSRPLRGRPKN